MIKAVLLDADGVVVKKHSYFSDRYKKEFGTNLNDDVISSFFRNEFKQALLGKADLKELLKNRLNNWGWNGTVESLLKYWFEGGRELDSELLKLVNKIRKDELKVYLASDNEKYRAKYLLDEVGLKKYFDDFFFSCDLGYTKSDKEFFEVVITKLGVKPGEIYYLDDDEKNVDMAKSVGISAEEFTSIKQIRRRFQNL